MISMSLLPLLLATAALAAPARRADATFRGDCNVPPNIVNIPAPLDQLTSPPTFYLLGVGVQNYTCNSNGTFDSVGTLAEMYDISCHQGEQGFASIQNDAFNLWANDSGTDPFEPGLTQLMKDNFNINVEGQYYFIPQNGSIAPVWDFTTSGENAGNPNAIVVAQKIKSAPSPNGTVDIDWVELNKTSGNLANQIYRVNTVKGQPPSSCTPGTNISVKYAADYIFV